MVKSIARLVASVKEKKQSREGRYIRWGGGKVC